MRSQAELEQFYLAQPAAPCDRGVVDLLVSRVASGVHETPAAAELTPKRGRPRCSATTADKSR